MLFHESDYELIHYHPEEDKSGQFWWLGASIVFAIASLMWTELFAMICLALMTICIFCSILTPPNTIPEQYIVRFRRPLTAEEWRRLSKYYDVDTTDPTGIWVCTKKEFP